MKNFLRITKALSDPNRVRVIKLLENRALCVCEIREVLGLAQPTVSSHMKILEDAGLVTKERQGTWMIYSQAEESDSPYAQTMLAQLRGWLNDDPELQAMIAALPAAACLKVVTLKA
ncbi:MAG: metalloregulator ArsR/SmtB family transcription factor [Desulfobulbus sp.]|nr:metalloregulator ArsR/SmtB family transcription factor [Desulfobulbus sp.]